MDLTGGTLSAEFNQAAADSPNSPEALARRILAAQSAGFVADPAVRDALDADGAAAIAAARELDERGLRQLERRMENIGHADLQWVTGALDNFVLNKPGMDTVTGDVIRAYHGPQSDTAQLTDQGTVNVLARIADRYQELAADGFTREDARTLRREGNALIEERENELKGIVPQVMDTVNEPAPAEEERRTEIHTGPRAAVGLTA